MHWSDRAAVLAALEVLAEHLETCEKRDCVDPAGLLPSDRLRGAIITITENADIRHGLSPNAGNHYHIQGESEVSNTHAPGDDVPR